MRADHARCQLAGLRALEAVVDLAMHALVESYRELRREPRPDDPADSLAAGELVDLCGRLLSAIDAHRRALAGHVPREDRHWPF